MRKKDMTQKAEGKKQEQEQEQEEEVAIIYM